MNTIDVTALEIRDYALCTGWQLVKEALKDGLFVLNGPKDDYTQLIFPKEVNDPFFEEMAQIALERLATTQNSSFHKIKEDIREVNDDVISLRYYSDNKNVNFMSFEEALGSIEATRQLLLSAASSVVNPALFHPKLNRSEAQDLIKKTRFRHTEEGSFILKISYPFESLPPNVSLDSAFEFPLSRNSFKLINESAILILNAIEEDGIQLLFENECAKESPILSYNLCESLSKLFDNERELPFQLQFNWSKASLLKAPHPTVPNKVSFSYDCKSKIEEVVTYFAPKKNHQTNGVFYGTVDTLDGSIEANGMRSGQVILSILHENELIKVKVNLSSTDYSKAIEAHQNGGSYVQIRGDLKRAKRINAIEQLTSFTLQSH